jgi:hypothetical protein
MVADMSRKRPAPSDIIDRLIVVLFSFVTDECNGSSTTSTSRDGFSFEDRVCKEAYDYIRKYPVTLWPSARMKNIPQMGRRMMRRMMKGRDRMSE